MFKALPVVLVSGLLFARPSVAEEAEASAPEQRPWTDDLLFGVTAGVPTTSSGELRLAGDVLLGYQREDFGAVGRGELAYYDLEGDTTLSNTIREGGSLDAWALPFTEKRFRLEVRASGEVELYDTELVDVSQGTTNVLSQETSLMWRGAFLAAARFEPSLEFVAGLWLGVGVQHEQYDALNLTGTTVITEQRDSASVLATARFRLQAALVPSVLALRVRSDVKYYQITRDSLDLSIAGPDISIAETAVRSLQLESVNRIFLDAEIARVLDFIPGITGGLDIVRLVPESGSSRVAVVPMVGIGIRTTTY